MTQISITKKRVCTHEPINEETRMQIIVNIFAVNIIKNGVQKKIYIYIYCAHGPTNEEN